MIQVGGLWSNAAVLSLCILKYVSIHTASSLKPRTDQEANQRSCPALCRDCRYVTEGSMQSQGARRSEPCVQMLLEALLHRHGMQKSHPPRYRKAPRRQRRRPLGFGLVLLS